MARAKREVISVQDPWCPKRKIVKRPEISLALRTKRNFSYRKVLVFNTHQAGRATVTSGQKKICIQNSRQRLGLAIHTCESLSLSAVYILKLFFIVTSYTTTRILLAVEGTCSSVKSDDIEDY